MKSIILIAMIVMFAGVAAAAPPSIAVEHYMVPVLIWSNETGQLEEDVAVTFDDIHTLYTANDGSVVYDVANLPGVVDGDYISVSCKYGEKRVPVVYYHDGERVWGMATTFNEPSESDVIAMFAALGIVATSLGYGIYRLKKTDKKIALIGSKTIDKEVINMTDNNEPAWKLKADFGVRALIATLALAGYVGVSALAVYNGDSDMIGSISNLFMPIITSIIVFYYGGSIIRDGMKK